MQKVGAGGTVTDTTAEDADRDLDSVSEGRRLRLDGPPAARLALG